MFHGRIHATKDNTFGYRIELLDLIGRNVQTGGHVLLFGDAKTIPPLDGRKPKRSETPSPKEPTMHPRSPFVPHRRRAGHPGAGMRDPAGNKPQRGDSRT